MEREREVDVRYRNTISKANKNIIAISNMIESVLRLSH